MAHRGPLAGEPHALHCTCHLAPYLALATDPQCAPDDTVKVTKGPVMTRSDTPVGVRSAPGACQGEGHGRF